MRLRRRVLLAAVVPLVLLATACERPQPEVPEVPEVPTADDSDVAAVRTPLRDEVPEHCEDLVAYTRLLELVAIPMVGSNDRLYRDDFAESSGRIARLTCQYGVPFDLSDPNVTPSPGASPTPLPPPGLVISVNSYTDPDIARGRVEDTVTAAQAGGSQVSARGLGTLDAYFMIDADDASYVVADGALTYVFTVRRGLVAAENEQDIMVTMAAEVVGVDVE